MIDRLLFSPPFCFCVVVVRTYLFRLTPGKVWRRWRWSAILVDPLKDFTSCQWGRGLPSGRCPGGTSWSICGGDTSGGRALQRCRRCCGWFCGCSSGVLVFEDLAELFLLRGIQSKHHLEEGEDVRKPQLALFYAFVVVALLWFTIGKSPDLWQNKENFWQQLFNSIHCWEEEDFFFLHPLRANQHRKTISVPHTSLATCLWKIFEGKLFRVFDEGERRRVGRRCVRAWVEWTSEWANEKRGFRATTSGRREKSKKRRERGTCYICLSACVRYVIDRCQLAYTLCAQVHMHMFQSDRQERTASAYTHTHQDTHTSCMHTLMIQNTCRRASRVKEEVCSVTMRYTSR